MRKKVMAFNAKVNAWILKRLKGVWLDPIFCAIFAIMWFFMIRPQQKKQKEIRAFQNSLQEGTKVVTGGGIYGTVKHIDLAANVIEVEIAKGTVIRVDKGYVFADAAASQMQQAQAK